MSILDYRYGKKYVEALIQKAFFYYNGKINIFNNPMELIINWTSCRGTNQNGHVCGMYTTPNRIVIHPYEITKIGNGINGVMEVVVVETIIHELYHADQEFHVHIKNEEYKYSFVELPVDAMTYYYMQIHKIEICRLFHIPIKIMNYKLDGYLKEYLHLVFRYRRRTLYSHIIMILENLIQDQAAIKHINHEMNKIYQKENSSIIIELNGYVLNVKTGNIFATVYEINSFFSIGNVWKNISVDDVSYGDVYILYIEVDDYNRLCKIV